MLAKSPEVPAVIRRLTHSSPPIAPVQDCVFLFGDMYVTKVLQPKVKQYTQYLTTPESDTNTVCSHKLSV